MAPPARKFFWNYEDLQKLTDKKYNSIVQDVRRGDLEPENLESLVMWLSRHARDDLKKRILAYALAVNELPERPGRRKRPMPARPASK